MDEKTPALGNSILISLESLWNSMELKWILRPLSPQPHWQVLQSQRMTDAVEMASPLASSAARRTGIRNAGTRARGISPSFLKTFL